MDGFKKNFLDTTEIDRIQKEIERNLYGAPQTPQSVTSYDNNDKYINATVESNADTPLNTDHSFSGLTVFEPIKEFKDPPSNVFYHETIKNETKRYKKKKFQRATAIILIMCTLGTTILGIVLGVGYPIVKNYFFPGINSENSVNYIDTPFINESLEEYDTNSGSNITVSDETIVIQSISDVIKLVSPTVVSIKSVSKTSSDFFNLPYNESGSGSGIIFSQNTDQIFITTNYSVISGASSVWVQIDDSDDIRASFVGSKPESDIAVISISKEDVKKAGINSVSIAAFGDSDKMQVGDLVIAIGNAFGEGNIVTSGIVSAVNKEVTINQNTLVVIQTDAAINPGNSGGPLINAYGEIIGINIARTSRSDVEGMSYSISSNIAEPILEDIMKQTPKPFLGIVGIDLTKDLADYYKLPTNIGVLVKEIVPDSSAHKAGIHRTDIITGFNGASIFSMNQLSDEIQKCKVGDEVTVKVYRDGTTLMEFNVKLTEYKTDNF